MTVWSGWQAQLLSAASLPGSSENSAFLSDWHSSANSNCTNNPVDISRTATGATNCHPLTGARTAKNYTSHGQAASAFDQELHSGNFPHLLAALNSGTPYHVPSAHDVIADLIVWGSETFAYQLSQNYGPPSGGGGGGGGFKNAQALKGWHSLQLSVNRDMRPTLADSNRKIRRALQSLSRAHRVKG